MNELLITRCFLSLHIPIAQLNLAAVLKCGQSFRWSSLCLPTTENGPTHEYRLCLRDRVVCLRQASDTLFYCAVFPDPQPLPSQLAQRDAETLAWFRDYFQLDIDLVRLYDQWSERDKVFARFRDRFTGIRILRQDPWENVVSYVGICLLRSMRLMGSSDSYARPTTIFPA